MDEKDEIIRAMISLTIAMSIYGLILGVLLTKLWHELFGKDGD